MSKTECGICIHRRVCKYVGRLSELKEKADYLLTEEDTNVCEVDVVCKNFSVAEAAAHLISK